MNRWNDKQSDCIEKFPSLFLLSILILTTSLVWIKHTGIFLSEDKKLKPFWKIGSTWIQRESPALHEEETPEQVEAIWGSSALSPQWPESRRKGEPWNNRPVASIETAGLVASSSPSLAFSQRAGSVMCPQQVKPARVLGLQRQSVVLAGYRDSSFQKGICRCVPPRRLGWKGSRIGILRDEGAQTGKTHQTLEDKHLYKSETLNQVSRRANIQRNRVDIANRRY